MFAPEREAVVLVSVSEEVVGRAVEHEAAGGALGGGRPLAQEALPLALPALGLGLALGLASTLTLTLILTAN